MSPSSPPPLPPPPLPPPPPRCSIFFSCSSTSSFRCYICCDILWEFGLAEDALFYPFSSSFVLLLLFFLFLLLLLCCISRSPVCYFSSGLWIIWRNQQQVHQFVHVHNITWMYTMYNICTCMCTCSSHCNHDDITACTCTLNVRYRFLWFFKLVNATRNDALCVISVNENIYRKIQNIYKVHELTW